MQHTHCFVMTPTCPTITQSQFQQAIAERDAPSRLTAPVYARRKILAASPDHCPLCRSPFDRSSSRTFLAPVVATCVHSLLGGPLTIDNLFVCCRRCQQSRTSTDLLTLPDLPTHLAKQRLTALQLSQNHPVVLPKSATLPHVRKALAQRHAMPRSRVYAAQADDGTCLLGVSRRFGDRESKGLANLLAQWAGKRLLHNKQMAIYSLADIDFRRVVWQLIDANAWVVGVGRRAAPRDFLDYWWVSTASVSELKARKVAGVAVPLPALDDRKVSPSAVRMRRMSERRKAAQEREEAEREFNESEAAFNAMIRRRHQPTAFPTDPDEELAVLTRYGKASRRLNEVLG
jgi:hypothetical protein